MYLDSWVFEKNVFSNIYEHVSQRYCNIRSLYTLPRWPTLYVSLNHSDLHSILQLQSSLAGVCDSFPPKKSKEK